MNIEEAAKRLEMPRQTLRMWIRNGTCPFGEAWKISGKNYYYRIFDKRFEAYINAEDIKKAPTV